MSAALDREARLTGRGSPYALEEAEVNGLPERVFKHGPKMLADVITKIATGGDRPLIVTPEEAWSCKRTFGAARGLAEHLAGQGVAASDRVALIAPNGPAWLIAFMACVILGAVPVLIPPREAAEVDALIARTACRFAIVEDYEAVHAWAGVKSIFGFDLAKARALADLAPTDWRSASDLVAKALDDIALVAFTSGSTGLPKPVALSHRGVVTGLFNMMLSGALSAVPGADSSRRPPCPMIFTPLSHISGYAQFLLMVILGGRVAFAPPHDTAAIAALCRQCEATALVGVSIAVLRDLLGDRSLYLDLATVRGVHLSGVAVPPDLIGEINDKLPDVIAGASYGMTETNGAVCSIVGAALKERPGSSGRLLPTACIRILDDQGREVSTGTQGEVWLRGAMLMKGYIGDDGSFSGVHEGWFQTGDLGYLSGDRHLYLVERVRDQIQIGGIQVSCADVERHAVSLGADEAYAFARAERDGEVRLVIAASSRKANSGWEAVLTERLVERLGLPAESFVVRGAAALPRNPTGKIDFRRIRADAT